MDHPRRVNVSPLLADEAQLKELDRRVKDIVSDAAEFAQNSPEPELNELYTDVYVET